MSQMSFRMRRPDRYDNIITVAYMVNFIIVENLDVEFAQIANSPLPLRPCREQTGVSNMAGAWAFDPIVQSFCLLCAFLMTAHLVRAQVKLLQDLHLPSSVIGGLLGLVVVQCVYSAGDGARENFDSQFLGGWNDLPRRGLPACFHDMQYTTWL